MTNVIRDGQRFHRARRRSPAREVPLADDEDLLAHYSSITSPSKALSAREEVARIEAAFARLPSHYAEVLGLAHVVGQSRAEMAATLELSVDAVAQRLRRATLRLARELDRC